MPALEASLEKNKHAATLILPQIAQDMQGHQHENAGRAEKRKQSRAVAIGLAGENEIQQTGVRPPCTVPPNVATHAWSSYGQG